MATDIALVTGAGSGIGKAIAAGLAERGARVIAADVDEQRAKDTAAEHDGMRAVRVDIADAESVEALRQWVGSEVGVPNILINAAGWDEISKFLDTTAEFATKVTTINYLGPVHMCRTFLPGMVESGAGGTIVNVASDAGRVGSAGETVYAGAKGGVIALTKSVAREVARHDINVNCVCPGPTDTPLFHSLPDKLKDGLIKAIPFRRLAKPEEVADAVLYFASPAASYITGQVLSVSGGLSMAG